MRSEKHYVIEGALHALEEEVFGELVPGGINFERRFRGADPTDSGPIHRLAGRVQDNAERLLWQQVHACLSLTLRGFSGHVEAARDCLLALRTLRNHRCAKVLGALESEVG